MLLNVLLLGFRRTGYGCVCLYEGIIFWIILNMFWTCVFFIVNVLFLDIFIVGFVLPLLKLAKMYRWLTLPATSRGPLWVLNWGVAACVTPLKHMLLVLSPSTMTETRTVSVRSSLMADEVKGHVWARMDFPQLYTGVCTSTWQITTPILNEDMKSYYSHIIVFSFIFFPSP